MKAKVIGVVAVVCTGASSAFAQTAFDPSTATTELSGAVTTATGIVAALVALGAGLAVYKKVKAFFSKSN